MERPTYELVKSLCRDQRISEEKEDALYRLAWLADNFSYSNREQAQKIMAETLPELIK